MPRSRGGPDLVELTVLAFLLLGPRHPYELHRAILETHKDYVTGLPRSLYHAVDRLARDELIIPVETHREGRRPERTVYEITGEGRQELAARLRQLLERPAADTTVLLAAVSLMGSLPPVAVSRALHTRKAVLEGDLAEIDAGLSGLRSTGLPRLLLLELEAARALRGAERDWVAGILTELDTGSLTWDAPLEGTGLPVDAPPQEGADTTDA